MFTYYEGFLSSSVGKEFTCKAGDPGSIHGLGRSAGEGLSCPLQDSSASQVVKNPPAMWEDLGSIPGLGRSLGEGNSYPLQYSCLENSKERGTWQAAVYGVTKIRTRLSDFPVHFHIP